MVGQPSPTLVWTATAAGLLIQFIVFAVIALDFYHGTLQRNSDVAENIATLIEQDIGRNIELYDLALQAVADSVKDPEVMALPPGLRQIAMFDRTTSAPGLGAMVVLDKDGAIALDSVQTPPRAGNFADREYFNSSATRRARTASTSAGRSRPVFNRAYGASPSAGPQRA
jgi:hypothetical protein